jgi:tetratricopeptide (TPR) repeat protein
MLKNATCLDMKCAYCDNSIQVHVDHDVVRAILCENLPGIFCSDSCAEGMRRKYPPGINLVVSKEFHLDDANRLLSEASCHFFLPLSKAIDFFVTLFARHPSVYDNGAVRLHALGERKEGYDVLRKGLKECGNSDLLLIELAVFLSMDGKHEMALDTMHKVRKQEDSRFSLVLGNIYQAQGLWRTAALCWEESLKLNPSEILAWNNLGYFYLSIIKDYERAEAHYRLALEHFPQQNRFCAFLGDAIALQGRNLDALSLYKVALSLPDDGKLSIDYDEFNQTIRDMILRCQERLDEGHDPSLITDVSPIIEPEKVLERAQLSPVSRLVEDANCLFGMHRYDDALRMYDTAIGLDPESYDAWANRGLLLLTVNRLEESLTSINKALQISSSPLGERVKKKVEEMLGKK